MVPWVISGRTKAALRDQAARLVSHVDDHSEQSGVDIAYSLATTRSGFEYRLAVVGEDKGACRSSLAAWLAGGSAPGAVDGRAMADNVTAFVFAGQGTQRIGMGLQLYDRFQVFAAAFDEVCAVLDGELGRSVRAVLSTDSLNRTEFTQPALFAVEVALFRLVESWGVRPDVLVGHSVGEVAAACVSGVLSLVDACRLVVWRGRLMQGLPEGGAMVAVRVSEENIAPLLTDGVSIAAVNGPESVVIAGADDAVSEAVQRLTGTGHRIKRLRVGHAFHTALMEPMVDEFRDVLSGMTFGRARIPLVSTVTGEVCPMDTVDYWAGQVRAPVRFADALAATGATVSVEIGPDGSLSALSEDIVPLLRRDRDEPGAVVSALAGLHVRGVTVDWAAFHAEHDATRVDLPTYAFQRQRYWPKPIERRDSRCYRVEWVRVADPVPAALSGHWLVAAPPGEPVANVVVTALGVPTSTVTVESDRVRMADRLRALPVRPDGVLAIGDLGPARALALVQGLEDAGIGAPLWFVTRGGVVIADDPAPDPEQACLWGLGTVVAAEYPDRWGGLVDLPADGDPAGLAGVLARADEDRVALRPAGVFGCRLVPVAAPEPVDPVDPPSTVLVTGGTGTAGAHIARQLAKSAVPRLILVSRRGPDAPGAENLRAELSALGAEVKIVACDVTDEQALAESTAGEQISDVYHAVRFEQDGVLDSMVPSVLDRAVEAAQTALQAVAAAVHPGTRFVVLGSLAPVLAGPGQGIDATITALLDAFITKRRADGEPATLVSSAPWALAGSTDGVAAQRMRRAGLAQLPPDEAVAVLTATGRSVVLVEADFARYASILPRPTRLLDTIPGVGALPSATDKMVTLAPEQPAALLDLVRSRAAAVLGHGSVDAIEPTRSFQSLGFDSLTAVELRSALATDLGRTLPATLVFDYPTPLILADHLAGTQHSRSPARTASSVADEPIAIVGMACRYPGGVRNPDDLWQLVAEGRDGIGAFPADRGWDLATLFDGDTSSSTREGGFLDGIDRFDAAFFGISPREALAMDPQQRLLSQVAWEAVERAGIDAHGLAGSATGVFVGSNIHDYPELLTQAGTDVLSHAGLGNAASVLSGRVAYLLGLEGPAVSVDTACSSSLVALHLAARSLRSGECDLALAGGVLIMATPAAFVDFSVQGGLASDGRCKAFSASADGTGWSEGVGVLVVERLSDARRLGHRVLALVRGSAVNSDGASNGLTAPNGPSQQRVIRAALADAGLEPSEVDVIEAHGTGTVLGDPIEAQALLATYGQDRDRPALLGSLKSNLGHAQSAAGVAGVIKMVQAMRHGVAPRTLHAAEASPHVDWAAGAVELLTEATEWPTTGRPRRAGISSFGVSGTNAHVIVEQAPPEPVADREPPGVVPWVLSAKTADALRDQAARLEAYVRDNPGLDPRDVGRTLACGRGAFAHRAAVVGDDPAGGLAALAAGEQALEVFAGQASDTAKVVIVFPGQGSQRAGMGSGLLARFPVFTSTLDEVLIHLDRYLDRPLRPIMFAAADTPEAGLLDRTEYAQPALFALSVALYRLVESWGIRPVALVGHSVGELAAAHVAGVFTLADAAELVVARGRLMGALPTGGAMVSVRASEDEVTPLLGAGVALAAVNGPSAVVLAGDEDATLALTARFAEQGRKTRCLPVSHAFHSPRMDAMVEDFVHAVRGRATAPAAVPVVSTVTGQVTDDLGTAEHWGRQVRSTVRFADAVRTAAGLGATIALDLGPDGTLAALAADTADIAAIPVLRRGRDDEKTAVTALARLHVAGVPVDWSEHFEHAGARLTDLPTYPFQEQSFWPRPAPAPTVADDWWSALDGRPADEVAASLGVDQDALAMVLPALAEFRASSRIRTAADGCRYRVGWVPVADPPRVRGTGKWLVVSAEADEWTSAVVAALDAITVTVEQGRDSRDDMAKLLDGHGDLAGVVSLLAAADNGPPAGPAGLGRTVALVQAFREAGIDAPLWCLTRGAVSVRPGERLRSPAQAGVWGLGRGVALEQPDLWGGLIDLPDRIDRASADRLIGLLTGSAGEDQLAVRKSGVHARRLLPAPGGPGGTEPVLSGTVLITGGTGALGAHMARDLAARGVPHLILTSRRGPDAPGADQLREELTALGCRVSIVACDAADRDALAAVVDGVPADVPLTGVVHAAGVLDDGMIEDLTPARLDAMLAAKSVAAWNLHDLTVDLDLTLFVLCSSIAGSIGAAAQGSYAAANALLDALAEHRRDLELPALSVSWSPWAGSGMGDAEAVATWMRRAGVAALSPELGMAALAQAVRLGDTTVTIADIDWSRYAPGLASVRPTRLLDTIPAAGAALHERADGDRPDVADLRAQLATMSAPERVSTLARLVRGTAATVLGYADAGAVAGDQAFADLGFDSLTSVEFRNRLAAATGLDLARGVVFDYPNPAALADRLGALLLPATGDPSALAEVDRLEAALAGLDDADDGTRRQIAQRLQAMAARCAATTDADLLTASDDEMFEFIGKEFGIS
ncbi:type I polyketide synthase [Kibdelosporangium aridum]|uniref:type I polyketide synthase n=1 Tax=Kibdelosporangium aridum TaxID=2030 RepID=UPI0035E9FCC6